MPAPQSSMLKQLAKLAFKAEAIKLPVDWKQPQGDPAGKHYVDAFKPSERAVPPDPSKLFIPATPNKYHVDTVSTISGKFEKFIDGVCDAICSAWSTWQSAATMVGVMIMGPVASMGQIVGVPWMPLILASAPKATPNELKYSNVIATVLGTAWLSYTASIKIPGMPLYPAFAAFPSPVAPPMPNLPAPLMALTQVAAGMGDSALSGQMIGQLGDPQAQHHKELFKSISKGVNQVFTIWQASTIFNNILGTGPIPTFAPPYVPVGPVVGGVGTMTPSGIT